MFCWSNDLSKHLDITVFLDKDYKQWLLFPLSKTLCSRGPWRTHTPSQITRPLSLYCFGLVLFLTLGASPNLQKSPQFSVSSLVELFTEMIFIGIITAIYSIIINHHIIFYPCSSVNIKVDTSFVIQVFQVFSVPVKIWGHQKIRGQINIVPDKKIRL